MQRHPCCHEMYEDNLIPGTVEGSHNSCVFLKVLNHDCKETIKNDKHLTVLLPANEDQPGDTSKYDTDNFCFNSHKVQRGDILCTEEQPLEQLNTIYSLNSNLFCKENSLTCKKHCKDACGHLSKNMSAGLVEVQNCPFSIPSSESDSGENDSSNTSLHVKQEEDILCHSKVESELEQDDDFDLIRNKTNTFCNVGIQVTPSHHYRLRFLPICGCSPVNENEWRCCGVEGMFLLLRLTGRWFFSQCGLAVILFAWALLGAAAFEATEGPREEEQIESVKQLQTQIAIELATELRLVKQDRPVWRETVQKYIVKHENFLLDIVSEGFGEGGANGRIWTYPGSFLFAVSLLTTLGFGAPVPRTTLARIAAVIFAAIGIPLHLLLMLNVGMLLAVKLQKFAKKWQAGTSCHRALYQCCCENREKVPENIHCKSAQSHGYFEECGNVTNSNSPSENIPEVISSSHFVVPKWLKWFPVVSILSYYTCGVLIFGVGRLQPFAACLLFPLDFTAAGGVGLTSGSLRICYAFYLEGAVMLAAISVSVLQVSATRGITELGLKLGLLTNS